MESIYLRLGERIRTARKRQGLTQENLAEMAHLSTAFIGQIERGQNVASLASVDKIARALDIPLSTLFHHSFKRPYKAAASPQQRIASLLRERPSHEQRYILETVKTVVRRLDKAPQKARLK